MYVFTCPSCSLVLTLFCLPFSITSAVIAQNFSGRPDPTAITLTTFQEFVSSSGFQGLQTEEPVLNTKTQGITFEEFNKTITTA
jgi:hypothetical protein